LASPLSLLKGRLDLLIDHTANEDVRRSVAQLHDQIQVIGELLGRAQKFAKRLRPAGELVTLQSELASFVPACTAELERAGITLKIQPTAAACESRLAGDALRDVLRGLCAFVCAKGPGATITIDVSRAARDLECVELSAQLAPHTALASSRRALMDPWLEDPTDDAVARLELALALGALQDLGGWYERGERVERPELTLFLPLRS
jgi:hypothetical protein